ncbi:Fic family protein [Virgibacillus natechei]
MTKTILDILIHEKNTAFRNGLYDYLNVKMAYDTSKIEGSTLTFSDTQELYEKNMISTGGHSLDDLLESKNHFELFDFMLETINEPLTERLIKEYHQILKKGTLDEKRYGIGKYKRIPNIAGDQKVAEPHEVPEKMSMLMEEQVQEAKNLDHILHFHHEFELIHPFQDGNGRVGRIIMLRDCLANHIIPFIISSERKKEYIDGLRLFKTNPNLLKDEVTLQQETFGDMAKPFLNYYNSERDRDL